MYGPYTTEHIKCYQNRSEIFALTNLTYYQESPFNRNPLPVKRTMVNIT